MESDDSSAKTARRRDRVQGLMIVAVAFLASLALSLWAKRASEPEQSQAPAPPTSAGLQNWPQAVDPVRELSRARELTRRLLLRGFVAEGVKSDGTLDLRGASGFVRYSFQSPQGHGPQPPREPGLVPRRDLCGRQAVRLDNKGMYAEADQADVVCSFSHGEPLPEPPCGLARVWQRAKDNGVSPDALARIEYYRAATGPAFRFELLDGSSRFSVQSDCATTLDAREAAGFVP